LLTAFQNGDPEKAWDIIQELLGWTGELVTESARERFRLNFGTERCQNCTGLKAGPGVVATCFQVQQCYYRHIRGDDLSPKQARVLDLLGRK